MHNQQNTTELAWLAGFIDGEGYLGLRIHAGANGKLNGGHYPTIRPEFHIVNTEQVMIEKAVAIATKLDVHLYVRKSQNGAGPYKKHIYKCQTKGINRCTRLLEPLLPYLTGSKLIRATLIVEFCKSRQTGVTYKNPVGNGSGRVKPYTKREFEIWELIQPHMRRGVGFSETTRGVLRRNAELIAKINERNVRFLDAVKI